MFYSKLAHLQLQNYVEIKREISNFIIYRDSPI